MQFNIEDGGALVSMSQVLNVIHAVNPDVVCIQESEGRIPYIASKLGWPYYDTRVRIISRFPIIDPPEGKGLYNFVEICPGKVIAVSNTHLSSDPYGPYLFEEGKSAAYVRNIEKSTRLQEVHKYLQVLPELGKKGIPTFLAGDFNAPSYLDWQKKNGFMWPVSVAIAQAGLRDSYREAYPDAQKNPGNTWWEKRPKVIGWNPKEDDPHDRIDYIYVTGPAKTLTSKTIGVPAFSPWPSDHAALVSTFTIEPASEPVFVAVNKRLLTTGSTLKVTYNTQEVAGQKIVLFSGDTKIATKPIKGAYRGIITFVTTGYKPGSYEARLMSKNGQIVSKIPFFIKAPDEKPTLWLTKTTYSYNEPITAHWKNAPGHHWDFLGITSSEKAPLMIGRTEAQIQGTYTFDGGTQSEWPLPRGTYTLSYFIDDSKREITSLKFSVE